VVNGLFFSTGYGFLGRGWHLGVSDSVTFCSLTLSDKGIDLSNSCGHGRVELIEKTKKTLPYNLAKVGLELKRN